jgi:chloride channel 2
LIIKNYRALISTEAEGSGIPEMKAIIAGIDIYKYLSLQTCFGKMIGLIAGLIGGLPIGREGPFVHISACVASKLAKFKCFEDINNNQALKKTMYSAAVAAGMTVAFGAPLGAIMFSIEVSTTYYMVSNLFKSFFCVTFSIIVYKVLEMLNWLVLYSPTKYPMNIVVDHEIFLFALLGIICGLLGAITI